MRSSGSQFNFAKCSSRTNAVSRAHDRGEPSLGAYRSGARAACRESLKKVEHYFPILGARARQISGVLSSGEQQMLAIRRALMALPRLLILDEPSLGLAPRIIDEIFDVMTRINGDGVTILVAEQNAMKVLKSVGHAYVLETGRIAHQERASDLMHDDEIKKSYLGVARRSAGCGFAG
jgi:branched-chain amino acid transport system ATP-binding protein